MSDLQLPRITGDALKAPPGMFRIVRATYRDKWHLQVRQYHHICDHDQRRSALEDAAARNEDPRRSANVDFSVIDSDGHQIGELGVRIEEYELRALPGRYRVVTFDDTPRETRGYRTTVYWLRYDVYNPAQAMGFCLKEYPFPYASSAILDDRGELVLL